MTTNQEARHQDLRDQTSTAGSAASDWHAFWDDQGVSAGTWNERMLAWVNTALGTSYTNVTEAMHAFASNRGFSSWAAVENLAIDGGGYLIEAGGYLLIETGDIMLLEHITEGLQTDDGLYLFTESGLQLEID